MPPTGNNLFGTTRLLADLSSLVNNSDGSDVQFLVGPDATSMYGHSVILRCRTKYFATIFNDEWKEKAKGIVLKPNISPVVFHSVLSYLYTGGLAVINRACLLDLLAVAEEMELDELSSECQTRVMSVLNQSIVDNKEENVREDSPGDEQQPNLPISFAIRRFLIPSLVFAYNQSLSDFLQELLNFTYSNIENILNSKDTLNCFLNMIPYQILHLIIASDSLPLEEYKVWDLALEWACRQTKVLKLAVKLQLKSNCNRVVDDESGGIKAGSASTSPNDKNLELEQQAEESDQTLVSDQQLKTLKTRLSPLIPAIRFTLMDPEQYFHFVHMFNFLIPTKRLTDIQLYFYHPNKGVRSDAPRVKQAVPQAVPEKFDSNIADEPSQKSLRQWIVEAKGISNCNSPAHLKFTLLFRASIHGFQASVFHQRCDNKGPTLVLVKSSNGYLFGGVNFLSWTSSQNGAWGTSTTNFLFALKDGQHRHDTALFKVITEKSQYATYNVSRCGPVFGSGNDLLINNQCNTSHSTSYLGNIYTGTGASPTTLAGENPYLVADYEVFAISL